MGSRRPATHNLLTSGDGTPQVGSTNAHTEDAQDGPIYDWSGCLLATRAPQAFTKGNRGRELDGPPRSFGQGGRPGGGPAFRPRPKGSRGNVRARRRSIW